MQNATAQVNAPAPPDLTTELRTWALRIASAIALVAVVGAPAAASWHGLTAFAARELGLSGGWQYVVPISLDGAAMYAALLGLRAILTGDSAIWPRVLTCAYALAASSANIHAASNDAAALYYGGASLSAVILWDTTLRALRRDQLREIGAIEGAAARYRPLRWVLAPDETGRAWRTAVLENIANPRTAIRVERGELTLADLDQNGQVIEAAELVDDDETDPDDDGPGGPGGEPHPVEVESRPIASVIPGPFSVPRALMVGTKAEAVRAAFDALGERNVPAALAWLAERNVTVDRSYAYTVSWSPRRPIRAAGGER